MAYTSKILLGRITKISGYEGAVAVKLDKKFTENIPRLESVFLEIEGRLVPFLISEYEYSGADIIKLMFDGYETIEKVTGFTGCSVFLTSGSKNVNNTEDLDDLTGYKVISVENTLIGHISEVLKNPGQWLLVITSPVNKEVLIPLHEDLIKSIDDNDKIIVMDIPEGLTDLN